MGCAVRLSDHGSVGRRLIPSGARSPRFNPTLRFLHEGAQKVSAAAEPDAHAFRACTVPDRRLLCGNARPLEAAQVEGGGPPHLSDVFSLARQTSAFADLDAEFAGSICRSKAKEPASQLAPRLSQFSPTSRRGADTAQPLAARTRNPIERPVARSGRRDVEERETI